MEAGLIVRKGTDLGGWIEEPDSDLGGKHLVSLNRDQLDPDEEK